MVTNFVTNMQTCPVLVLLCLTVGGTAGATLAWHYGQEDNSLTAEQSKVQIPVLAIAHDPWQQQLVGTN